MKIYTKKGDTGTTALISGARVAKDDPRVDSYGTVDELSAFIAYLRDSMAGDELLEQYRSDLEYILRELMIAQALLALDSDAPENIKIKMPSIKADAIKYLEQRIDEMDSRLVDTRLFTIPGGHPLVSLSHVCRTVCRRAERVCVKASHKYTVNEDVISYLNRLSDYLYLLGRTLTDHFKLAEKYWNPND